MAKRAPDRKRISADVKRRQINPRKSDSKGRGGKGRQSKRPKEVTTEDLQSEYAYVIKDLRRIFILAGVMFALLITANILYPILFS